MDREKWSWTEGVDDRESARELIRFAAKQIPHKFCGQDQVLIRYLEKYALTDADWILTVQNEGSLVGLALVRKRGTGWKKKTRKTTNKWVELDVICAWDIPGLGTRILQEVERFSVNRGAQLVELHSVPNAIPFYRARGYVNAGRRMCREDPRITRAATELQVALKRFKSPQESLLDPDYRRFLTMLATIGSKAGALRGCKQIGLVRPECSYYGYRMNRCLLTPETS